MNLLSVSMHGDVSALAAQTGENLDATLVFDSDGTVAFLGGAPTTYSIDSNGLSMDTNEGVTQIKKLGNNLIIDVSETFGLPLAMVFSK